LGNVIKILDSELAMNEIIRAGYGDVSLSLSHHVAMGIANRVVFNLWLAQELDYCSGLINKEFPRANLGES
jgi:hypothetical protein